MYYLYAIFSILSWGIAPVIFKLYFSEVPIFVSLISILFFAGLTSLFNKKVLTIFSSKSIIFSCAIVSFLTIIHYLGNFYGIVYGNIILTTLIIKNSPFFQSIIYAYINKKKLSLGPTNMSGLKTLPDKINSYLPKWDYLFIVLFNVQVVAYDEEKNIRVYQDKKKEILDNTIESKRDKIFFIEI